MWKDYLGTFEKEYMENRDGLELGEESFRRINEAVIQDVEDYLIRKGMGDKLKMYEDGRLFYFSKLIVRSNEKDFKRRKRVITRRLFPGNQVI